MGHCSYKASIGVEESFSGSHARYILFFMNSFEKDMASLTKSNKTVHLNRGQVCGRKVLPIKICSCPKRDKDRQERDFKKTQQNQNKPQSSKRLATSSVNDSQQPALKAIKVEESNFEDSQVSNE